VPASPRYGVAMSEWRFSWQGARIELVLSGMLGVVICIALIANHQPLGMAILLFGLSGVAFVLAWVLRKRT
jgi:hypothetical protein